jgi:hypothetical protein
MNTEDTILQRIDAVGVQWDCLEGDLGRKFSHYRFFREPMTRQFGVEGTDDGRHVMVVTRFQMTTPQSLVQFHEAVDRLELILRNRSN